LLRGGKVSIPHKTKFLNVEEGFAHDKNGQEKGGCSYTNKEKGKQTECAVDSALFVSYMVNSACKSNFLQVALANMLVVVEASNSNSSKPKKNVAQKGCCVEAHSKRGVEAQVRDHDPRYAYDGHVDARAGPVREEVVGLMGGETVATTLNNSENEKGSSFMETNNVSEKGENLFVENNSGERICLRKLVAQLRREKHITHLSTIVCAPTRWATHT